MKEKYKNLLQSLKSSPFIISDYLLPVPDEQMDEKRRQNFWTIRKHLAHLVQTQDLIYKRILRFKNEEEPEIKPYFPEKDEIAEENNVSTSELIDKLKTLRNRQIELLESLSEKDFQKKGIHGEYKKYDLEIIMNHILFHDYWHMYRIEELLLTKDEFLTE
jgi:uncharacterized damage-inducible protein DinB